MSTKLQGKAWRRRSAAAIARRGSLQLRSPYASRGKTTGEQDIEKVQAVAISQTRKADVLSKRIEKVNAILQAAIAKGEDRVNVQAIISALTPPRPGKFKAASRLIMMHAAASKQASDAKRSKWDDIDSDKSTTTGVNSDGGESKACVIS